jgi:ubiquinone/menaquinone biosynthesis C-methylase UbiE
MTSKRTFFPATGWDWLLPIYDPLAKLMGADKYYGMVVDWLELVPGHRVLDIGCGTGTLAVRIKQLHPGVAVVGLDPDPRALARGARKAQRAGVAVHFDQGFSDQLPYAGASFDRVHCNIFSLLPHEEKETTLGEVRRVLKPGGAFHLLDLAKTPPGFSFWRLFKRTQRFEFCTEDQFIALMRQAGLSGPRKTREFKVWFWYFASYQASR